MGAGAIDVMRCKYEALNVHQDFSLQLAATKRMLPFKERERIKIKEGFSVTPYFVSHSAFDAYMFLIECEGKKILHTGDFRRHGYLGKGLFPTLEKYIGHVDLLITEGTMLGRKQEQVVTEKQIQLNTIRALCEHKYVFALCSSTDIDRLASFHAACKATGKVFLVDGYQRGVLDVFSEYSGKKSPLYNFNHIFELSGHKAYRIPKIKDYLRDKGFLMPVRMNSLWLLEDMLQVFNDEAPWLIYSMWSGYAEKGGKNTIENVLSIRKLFENRILDGVEDGFHTSGHADVETLYEVCKAVRPSIGVIPIHKDTGMQYVSDNYTVFNEGKFKLDGIEIEAH
jgi:ribonuclease J